MSQEKPRSPYDSVAGLLYFARMIDKLRKFAAGTLDEDYHENLGDGFDERCTTFLRVPYGEIRDHALANPAATDEELLAWCFERGGSRTEEDIEIWSEFMRKRGLRDSVSERLASRVKEAGLEGEADGIYTMFDFIDVDEGRTPPKF